jgi:hypothetical protein
VPDQIYGVGTVLAPEIYLEYTEGTVNFVDVDFPPGLDIAHGQAHAGWRGDRPSILVAKAAHAGSDGLLLDHERVHETIFGAHIRITDLWLLLLLLLWLLQLLLLLQQLLLGLVMLWLLMLKRVMLLLWKAIVMNRWMLLHIHDAVR